MSELFEQAARLKIRFTTATGLLSVEDLWDLPLTSTRPGKPNLDDLAIFLNNQLKEENTTSFVKKTSKGNASVRLAFDIVLRVIEVRQAEAEAADQKRNAAEKKQKLLELISQKQDEALKGKSIDELQVLINAL